MAESTRFTGKERDSESGLDYFGARYYGSALGRFTSPDPKIITKQRVTDPQQWNGYSYTRNNPLQFIDPDGKELKLAIYNSAGISQADATRVANQIAGRFSAAGIKNVTYELHSGAPSTLTLSEYAVLPTPHSHLLEIRGGKEGSGVMNTNIPENAGGQNFEAGGHSAIDASVVHGLAKGPMDLTTGLANAGTHEISHDTLLHTDDSDANKNNFMNPSAEGDPSWLFNLQSEP